MLLYTGLARPSKCIEFHAENRKSAERQMYNDPFLHVVQAFHAFLHRSNSESCMATPSGTFLVESDQMRRNDKEHHSGQSDLRLLELRLRGLHGLLWGKLLGLGAWWSQAPNACACWGTPGTPDHLFAAAGCAPGFVSPHFQQH